MKQTRFQVNIGTLSQSNGSQSNVLLTQPLFQMNRERLQKDDIAE